MFWSTRASPKQIVSIFALARDYHWVKWMQSAVNIQLGTDDDSSNHSFADRGSANFVASDCGHPAYLTNMCPYAKVNNDGNHLFGDSSLCGFLFVSRNLSE
jgi:hypothetical protein